MSEEKDFDINNIKAPEFCDKCNFARRPDCCEIAAEYAAKYKIA